jgi:hypothetical protein
MTTDPEWQWLSDLWASDSEDDAVRLRKMVNRSRFRLAVGQTGEALVLAGLGALTVVGVQRGLTGFGQLWLATCWAFAIIASALSLWNQRGMWKPLGSSTTEYLRVFREHCRRARRNVRLAIGLYIAEVIVIVAELALFHRLTGGAILALAALGVPLGAWAVATERRVRREAESAAAFEGE